MPGNKRFYDQVHFLLAKYAGHCSECPMEVNKDDPVVFLSDYRVTMHLECFRMGPPVRGEKPPWSPREMTYETKARFFKLLSSVKGGVSGN